MKLINIKECPACGSEQTDSFQRYDSFPAIIFPVAEYSSASVENRPLSSRICKICHHIFLDTLDTVFLKSIYIKYYSNYPFKDLETMHSSYRLPFESLVNSYIDLQKCKTLLEIGSDNPMQLEYFVAKGIACTAINPQAKPDDNVRFIDGYYGEHVINEVFDLIVSRFNLEHILNPDIYFKSIIRNSHSDTKVILQVPNVEYFINSGMLNILAHEHAHYFNVISLQRMLSRYGFRIIFCSEPTEPSLICAAVPSRSNHTLYSRYVEHVQSLTNSIASVLMQYDSGVVVYGASMSLSSLLYNNINVKELMDNVSIVDDNPIVQGRYMPGTNMKIVGIHEIDLVKTQVILLLLNKVYHESVIKKLKQLNYKGMLCILTDQKLKQFQFN